MSDADAGFFRNLSGLATEYVRQKRRTLAAGDPETNVDADQIMRVLKGNTSGNE